MKRLCTAALLEDGSRSAQLLSVLRHELLFVGASAGRLLDNEPFRGQSLVVPSESTDAAVSAAGDDDDDVSPAPVSYLLVLHSIILFM